MAKSKDSTGGSPSGSTLVFTVMPAEAVLHMEKLRDACEARDWMKELRKLEKPLDKALDDALADMEILDEHGDALEGAPGVTAEAMGFVDEEDTAFFGYTCTVDLGALFAGGKPSIEPAKALLGMMSLGGNSAFFVIDDIAVDGKEGTAEEAFRVFFDHAARAGVMDDLLPDDEDDDDDEELEDDDED